MRNIIIFLLIMSYSLTAQSTILSRLELELFILTEEIGSINDDGIFFELESQQPFVYKYERTDRYNIFKDTDADLLEGTYPYDAPGPYYHDIIKENSTYPNNMTWK